MDCKQLETAASANTQTHLLTDWPALNSAMPPMCTFAIHTRVGNAGWHSAAKEAQIASGAAGGVLSGSARHVCGASNRCNQVIRVGKWGLLGSKGWGLC